MYLSSLTKFVKTYFLELLFPIYCLGCEKTEGTLFCHACRTGLQMIPPACFVCKKLSPGKKRAPPGRTCKYCRRETAIFAFLSPFLYSDKPLRSLIHALKYNRVKDAGKELADLLLNYLQYFRIVLPNRAILIPIPLYPSKERTRGFNQTRLIAERLSVALGLPLAADLLKKTKDTRAQAELERERRLKNVAGVFEVSRPELLEKKTVILVDDVKTTGATLEEAAKALKKAGASRIWAITIAH